MITSLLNDKSVPTTALQIAAKEQGLDECGFLNIIEADFLTDNQIYKLVKKLQSLGYSHITFDPEESGPFYSETYGALS